MKSAHFRPNVYFYWPRILSQSVDMNCASWARVTESLEINVFIWNNAVLAATSSKDCTQKHFWQVFSFYLLSLLDVKLLLLQVETSVRIDSYKLCLLCKTDQILRDKCLSLKRPGIGCKKFQRLHPEPFLTSVLFFFTQVTIGQTFTSTGLPFCPNWFIWTVPLVQRNQILRDKYLYLERSSIVFHKFQRLHRKTFLTGFQVLFP